MIYLQTVMSEKSSGVTAGQGIEDPIHTQTKSTMLNRLLGSGTYVSYDMRCMVTGQFAVGKSSLVKLLAGDVVPEGRHPTDGISLLEGRCGLDVETRSWIYIDPETYDALDVVYNKVLMTSVEEDERKEEKTPKKPHLPDSNPVRSDGKVMTAGPSQQPLAAKPLSPQISDSVSKRIPELKTHMKSKMTKEEIRKRMEKVLKSGNYKMKVGRLIFWDFGGQYVYYTTHQTFMTFRALFLVVFDGSKHLHEEVPDVLCFPGQHMTPTPAVFLQHWVNSILTYCKVVYVGIPKILFVATHKDKIPVNRETSKSDIKSTGTSGYTVDDFSGSSICPKYGLYDGNNEHLDPKLGENKPVDSFQVGQENSHRQSLFGQDSKPKSDLQFGRGNSPRPTSFSLDNQPIGYLQFGLGNSPRPSSQNTDDDIQTGSLQFGRGNSPRPNANSHTIVINTKGYNNTEFR
ncbi:Hypothetical predicted protein [Mytilus galloprovincialis]|nr:Hypothetical predicted protein [Mytilus galloprovincialis]